MRRPTAASIILVHVPASTSLPAPAVLPTLQIRVNGLVSVAVHRDAPTYSWRGMCLYGFENVRIEGGKEMWIVCQKDGK